MGGARQSIHGDAATLPDRVLWGSCGSRRGAQPNAPASGYVISAMSTSKVLLSLGVDIDRGFVVQERDRMILDVSFNETFMGVPPHSPVLRDPSSTLCARQVTPIRFQLESQTTPTC